MDNPGFFMVTEARKSQESVKKEDEPQDEDDYIRIYADVRFSFDSKRNKDTRFAAEDYRIDRGGNYNKGRIPLYREDLGEDIGLVDPEAADIL